MSRSNALWLLGVGLLAACVGACTAPVSPPEPMPEPALEPELPPPEASAADLKALAEGNNAFAIDLYKKLAEKQDGNIIFSPYSISSALAMTYAGARGQTAEEMKKVLHFTLPLEKLHPAYGALAHQLQGGKDKPFQLNLANALWGQEGFAFRPEFLSLTKRNYAGGFREVDFQSNPDTARHTINRWVEEQTQDKIKNLLHEDDVHKHTSLVLVNAVYFKGLWAAPFAKSGTAVDNFWLTSEEYVPVPMMHQQVTSSCYEGDGIKLVVLPYQGGTKSLVLIVPNARDGLAAIERQLSAEQLRSWIANRTEADIRLFLPTFRVTERYKLADTLRQMGMQRPFDSDADFTGVTSEIRFRVQQVIHEAVVEVNEEGTVAAAATATIGALPITMPLQPRTVTVRADHPFLFLILDHVTQSILFVGRVVKP